jgi:hypothetical protein
MPSLTVETHADGSDYIQLSGAGLAQGCCYGWSRRGGY